MEPFKPIHFSRGCAALLAASSLVLPLSGAETRGGANLASSELSRRSVALDEAQELLRKGDEAYTAGRYSQAVEAYSGARDLIPNAPISAELRAAATERYAQASVEHARILSRGGDVAGAKAVVDKVLAESVAPDNPGALAFRSQLDDPIRTNPALTAAHAKDVDAVRRLLYTAEGAYNLGKFDEANAKYSEVLRIDPTNTAARRGMERVAGAKTGYQKSAYDQTRAELLGQVDSQWELQVPTLDLEATTPDPGADTSANNFVSVRNKLDRIIIPKVNLDETSLEEALEFLRIRAGENDTLELDPAHKGVNFTVNLGPADSLAATKVRSTKFNLQLSNVPLSQVLKYICDVTRTSFTTDDFSVIITPTGASSVDLVSRTYRVPPDFISSMSSGSSAGAAPAEDPFAATPATGGLLAKRLGAQEALAQQGVNFPEGASASYTPATNTLRVVNTEVNQDYVSQIIETITKTEPVMVSVKVTMIKVEQTTLKELGFDWFLENATFGKDLFGSGGTVGNGKNSPDVAGPGGVTKLNPVTAGNRSGDTAIPGNSIDALLTGDISRQSSNPAPGILGLAGNFPDGNVQMLMRGLDQKKGVDIMAQPTTVTRSGQSSSVKIVREFIYPTEYEPPELANSVGIGASEVVTIDEQGNLVVVPVGGGSTFPVTPATPTAFETREVGVILEVLPVVDANKQYISVTLKPEFVDFKGFVNYGSPINSSTNGLFGLETIELTKNAILMPVFSKDAVSTTVDVVDGGTVAVGGMVKESVQNVNDRTPILGSIPIIGRLFETTARKPISTMVIFLVNVELMDPTGHRYRDR